MVFPMFLLTHPVRSQCRREKALLLAHCQILYVASQNEEGTNVSRDKRTLCQIRPHIYERQTKALYSQHYFTTSSVHCDRSYGGGNLPPQDIGHFSFVAIAVLVFLVFCDCCLFSFSFLCFFLFLIYSFLFSFFLIFVCF